MKKLFFALIALTVCKRSYAQILLPLETEIGIRTVSVQTDAQINSFEKISLRSFNPSIGFVFNPWNPGKTARYGADSPMKIKLIYGNFNFGRFLRDSSFQQKNFFERLGRGGAADIFIIGFKKTFLRSGNSRDDSWKLNSLFGEISVNWNNFTVKSDSTGSSAGQEFSSTSQSIQSYALTLGYQFQFISNLGKSHHHTDPKGRVAVSIAPALHGFVLLLPDGITSIRQLMESKNLNFDVPNQEIDKERPYEFSPWGVGVGCRIGLSINPTPVEMFMPGNFYFDFRVYAMPDGRLGPGFDTSFRPKLTMGYLLNLNGGMERNNRNYSGDILQKYKNFR